MKYCTANEKSACYGLFVSVTTARANCTKILDASRRVLNIQLKEFEEHELVPRKIYPVVPPKVEYSLTEFGKTVISVIGIRPINYMLINWGIL
ncbi:winged helix-turn-helix transcriptional regulator [Dyadobacter fanqingshengii]|uniref:Winged helix-turn-helix transcriptional regulator n=1 Tax=Dyadobacter fanqingshengii TaxID=2906443 RepID=A0A9X1PAE0_9BACT|nr:winged helix-turn-helix transcriptional regulator [Dyadobacter fanqingshengii]MCF0039750.1 winged helix-turn-helix transcriptional regulator [Dyadobacter fanqingshengii]USJ38488.1 winged helix-turn-helix transcriptional regulator [Dyadobacter fanqingshengii]